MKTIEIDEKFTLISKVRQSHMKTKTLTTRFVGFLDLTRRRYFAAYTLPQVRSRKVEGRKNLRQV